MNRPLPTIEPTRETLLTRLVQEHARLLYRVAFAVLRNPADAEDAVQDALLKLLRARSLPELRDERAFLARSVYRAAIDRIGARLPVGATGEAAALHLAELRDPRPSPETEASAADLEAHMAGWIADLPPELREALLITAIDGLNSREASEILGVPDATVRTRLHRARGILRERAAQLATRRGRSEVAATANGDPR